MSSWFEKLPRPQYASLQRIAIDQNWFQVYQLRPTVFVIYEPYQCEEVLSYLIVGSQKALLIDTGMGIGNISQVVNQLTTLPLIVINTHTHHDHIGDNWRFEKTLVGVQSDFSKKNYEELFNDAQEEIKDGMICFQFLPVEFDKNSYRIKPFEFQRYVTDRECLNLGDDRRILVIFTPGHTPDSISLLDIENKLLFVGDIFYQGPIFLYRSETNLTDYVNSLKVLNRLIDDYQVEMVVPAHNTPNVDPQLFKSSLKAITMILTSQNKPNSIMNNLGNEYDCGEFSYVIKRNLLTNKFD